MTRDPNGAPPRSRRSIPWRRLAIVVSTAVTAVLAGSVGEVAPVVASSEVAAPATPDPTDPPADAPDTTADIADDAPDDGDAPEPEPGDVSPAVWIGAGLLVVLAVGFAVGRSTKSSKPVDES